MKTFEDSQIICSGNYLYSDFNLNW